jgi:hypothetical protein
VRRAASSDSDRGEHDPSGKKLTPATCPADVAKVLSMLLEFSLAMRTDGADAPHLGVSPRPVDDVAIVSSVMPLYTTLGTTDA